MQTNIETALEFTPRLEFPMPDDSQLSVYRILDASINRASEGLRVVEDFVRMSLNDAHLTERLKQLRHGVIQATSRLDSQLLIAARDTQSDVGTLVQTKSEYNRSTESGIVQANMSRLQQSLRTLEEYSKTISNDTAKQIEQLRYSTYTIEKAIVTTMMSCQKLADARVYVLIDARENIESFSKLVQQLISAGTDLIQLRDKRLSDREMLGFGRRLTELTRDSKTRWIMNDRADLALAARADGVHLGQTDLPVAEVRRMMGANRLIGVSTHNIEQAHSAVMDGANYIGVGPVFASNTKSFDEFPGMELVRHVGREIQLPAFAIGGIVPDKVSQIVRNGLHRIAVKGCVLSHQDPAAAVVELRTGIENALHDH